MSIKVALEKEQVQGKLPEFQFVSVNCMELMHPADLYDTLADKIFDSSKKGAKFDKRVDMLEEHFTCDIQNLDRSPRGRVVVLLLDEIDQLVTEKQTVLYNLFDWPKRSFEGGNCRKLIVVGISNTINLPTRLKPSVRSRIAKFRCNFAAYKGEVLEQILTAKVKADYEIFSSSAIKFISKKVGNGSGDVRKAFAICRDAAETVLGKAKKEGLTNCTVQIGDVNAAIKRSHNTMLSRAIAAVHPFQALCLVALASLRLATGKTELTLDEVHTKVKALASASGMQEFRKAPTWNDMIFVVEVLTEVSMVEKFENIGPCAINSKLTDPMYCRAVS